MTISEIDARLQKIWKEYDLEPGIKERGFAFAEPKRAELLITGINPSWRGNEQKGNFHGPAIENFSSETWRERNGKTWDTYFGPIRNMLVDEAKQINLLNRMDYLGSPANSCV